MARYNIGLVGLGKIAQDQHVPVIAGNSDFEVAAVTSRRGLTVDDAPTFASAGEMYAAMPELDAVALCTPPGAHFDGAREALAAGKHVLLEKPPTVTLSELSELRRLADTGGRTLFATWHSRFNEGVERAQAILADKTIATLAITWKEDVRRWHPGQAWIWEPGGFGVFDPGINALSILTHIVPRPVSVRSADLEIPANCRTPIAARIVFSHDGAAGPFTADFDWRQTGPQTWDIDIRTGDGLLLQLRNGGGTLLVDGVTEVEQEPDEYERIYARFGELLASGASDVDEEPLRLVADSFLSGRLIEAQAFHDEG